jgi:hypothetical protein
VSRHGINIDVEIESFGTIEGRHVAAGAGFSSPLEIHGPLRPLVQMLGAQSYESHPGIHDATVARSLGLDAPPIEGPTYFSQFDPLLTLLWGARWFTHGTLSCHFVSMCSDGDETRAAVRIARADATSAEISMHRPDGTVVLTGSALATDAIPASAARQRLAGAIAPVQPVILDALHPGQRFDLERGVCVGFDLHLGALYPFTLGEKLAQLPDPSPWYRPGAPESPWGQPVLPFEMVNIVALASFPAASLARQPSVGLFLDLEVRMCDGPLLVDEPYDLERVVLALGHSRRTESYWLQTTFRRPDSGAAVAEVLLHQGFFKQSYPDYPESLLN